MKPTLVDPGIVCSILPESFQPKKSIIDENLSNKHYLTGIEEHTWSLSNPRFCPAGWIIQGKKGIFSLETSPGSKGYLQGVGIPAQRHIIPPQHREGFEDKWEILQSLGVLNNTVTIINMKCYRCWFGDSKELTTPNNGPGSLGSNLGGTSGVFVRLLLCVLGVLPKKQPPLKKDTNIYLSSFVSVCFPWVGAVMPLSWRHLLPKSAEAS